MYMAVLHYSASNDVSAATIDAWHKQRGFTPRGSNPLKYIGYHYVVRKDGTIEPGRSDNVQGTHCPGFNLPGVLAICFPGDDKYEWYPTPQQYTSGVKLLRQYHIPTGKIHGHGQLYPTSCPGRLDIEKIEVMLKGTSPVVKEEEVANLELDRRGGDYGEKGYVFILNRKVNASDILTIVNDVAKHDFEVTFYIHPWSKASFTKLVTPIGGYDNRDGNKGMMAKIDDLTSSPATSFTVTVHSPHPLHGGT